MIAKGIDVIQPEGAAQAAEHQPNPDGSFEDDVGPNFNDIGSLPNAIVPEHELGIAIEQATQAVNKYIQDSKGYVTINEMLNNSYQHIEVEKSVANKARNKDLKRRYDQEP